MKVNDLSSESGKVKNESRLKLKTIVARTEGKKKVNDGMETRNNQIIRDSPSHGTRQ